MSKKGQKSDFPLSGARGVPAKAPANASSAPAAPVAVAASETPPPPAVRVERPVSIPAAEPSQPRVAKGKGLAPASKRVSLPPPSKARRVSKPPPEAPATSVPPVATVAPVPSVASVAPAAPAAPPRSRRTGDETQFGQSSPPPAVQHALTPTVPSVVSSPAKADSVKTAAATAELDDHAEHFFKEGEAAEKEARAQSLRPSALTTGDHEPADPRLLQLASPAARARRAKFEKWVKAAVGVSAVLCLAALVRVAVARVNHGEDPRAIAGEHAAQAAQAVAPGPVVSPVVTTAATASAAAAPTTAPASPPAAPAVAADSPAATTAAPPAAPAAGPAQAAAPAAIPADPAQATVAAPAASDKTAVEEKKDAHVALERGKIKDAIAAGERSVALDPTDGEAWLILGAAYQESGKGTDARRCFNACLKQAKKGPLGECRAMLQ